MEYPESLFLVDGTFEVGGFCICSLRTTSKHHVRRQSDALLRVSNGLAVEEDADLLVLHPSRND